MFSLATELASASFYLSTCLWCLYILSETEKEKVFSYKYLKIIGKDRQTDRQTGVSFCTQKFCEREFEDG